MDADQQPKPDAAAARLAGSIIVPAHNEAAVIARTLRSLAPLAGSGVDLVVVANGCTDATVQRARDAAPWATVIDSPVPSKALAIRRGEKATDQLPRLFVDADVQITARAARATLTALEQGAVAARPPFRYDASGASWAVRRYYRARTNMPSLHRHAWGAGVYGLSRQARARFGEFPDVVGDDLWVDSLLAPGELVVVDTDPVVVTTPRDSANLLKILRRGQVTKSEPDTGGTGASRPAGRARVADLRAVLATGPAGLIDALAYASFAGVVRLRPGSRSTRWERDESSRAGG